MMPSLNVLRDSGVAGPNFGGGKKCGVGQNF